MRIKVIDAFGMVRGTATVEWETADYSKSGMSGPDEETRLIFPELVAVTLPTRNERMPWRLEVQP